MHRKRDNLAKPEDNLAPQSIIFLPEFSSARKNATICPAFASLVGAVTITHQGCVGSEY